MVNEEYLIKGEMQTDSLVAEGFARFSYGVFNVPAAIIAGFVYAIVAAIWMLFYLVFEPVSIVFRGILGESPLTEYLSALSSGFWSATKMHAKAARVVMIRGGSIPVGVINPVPAEVGDGFGALAGGLVGETAY